MIFFVLRFAILLAVIALLVYAVKQASGEFRTRRTSRKRLVTDIRRRPTSPHQRVTDGDLAERARELRAAIRAEQITLDEAVGSLTRFGGAAVSPERARALLTE